MCSCYQPFQGCSYVNHLRAQHKVLSCFLSFLHQNTSFLPDQPTSFPSSSPILRWQWHVQFGKSIPGSDPAVPEFQQCLPKFLSLTAFLSLTFSASLFLAFLNRFLSCFPSIKTPNLPDSWQQSMVSPSTRKASQYLHHGSLQFFTCTQLYSSCSHELASSSHIFSHLSMLVFTSGTPSTLFMIQMAALSMLYKEHLNSLSWKLYNDPPKRDSIITLTRSSLWVSCPCFVQASIPRWNCTSVGFITWSLLSDIFM